MSHTERRKIWKDRIIAFQASGQSAATWCAANQLTTRKLWYWQRKFKNVSGKAVQTSQWISLDVDKQHKPTILIKVGSAEIKVETGYNRELLADVIRTLQSLC